MAPVAPHSGRRSALQRALVFIGFMGAGKSTAAVEAAAALGVSALDSDLLLEQRLGHSLAHEFALHGEQAFRAREEQLVCELLEHAGPGTVIALGGGSVLSERVRHALAPHLTVLLEIDAHLAWERVSTSAAHTAHPGESSSSGAAERVHVSSAAERPLARDRDAFGALYAERRGLYEGLADAFLPAHVPGVATRALDALHALVAAPAGTRLLWASAASGEYPVLVGRGLLHTGAAWSAEVWPLGGAARSRYCVTDETVANLHAPPPGAVRELIAIPAGERHKTLASAEEIWRALVRIGMTRADHIVALGGGVVGDLAGFCAATYQRGVPVVQVPTTLVAQVDSAYGGKTGVDLPAAKNYVGAYHQPAGVLVDPATLLTLPPAELAAGYVEVLKTGLIAGGELWARLTHDEPVDEWTILACARLKLAVVAEDERDSGRRQVLNLGHTVAHAIESVTHYERYRHGEAVGLGLLAALRLSGQDALREQVRELLLARGLPVELQGASASEVVQATVHDKKRLGSHVPFVLLEAPGEVRIGCEVPAQELLLAVTELI
jgi:shikimate kinase / 3-dehydroquinate synthase